MCQRMPGPRNDHGSTITSLSVRITERSLPSANSAGSGTGVFHSSAARDGSTGSSASSTSGQAIAGREARATSSAHMTARASQAYMGNRDGSARCSSGSFETSSHGPRQRSTPCSVMCEPSANSSTPANTVGSTQPTRVPRNTTANTTTSVAGRRRSSPSAP